MKRRPRLTQATKFTLFSTGFILLVLLVMYAAIILDMIADENNPAEVLSDVVQAWHGLLFVAAGIMSYAISGVIIDSIFNPLRQMSSKMAEVSNMNFNSPLVVDASDDELRDVAYAFNTMTAKLSKYINMQKRFVQDASHELATPITVIKGHADLAIRRGHKNPRLAAESLATIKAEIERMSRLVDGLLMLAKSDSESLAYSFDVVDLAKLINDVVEESRLINPDIIFEASDIFCPSGAMQDLPKNHESSSMDWASPTPTESASFVLKVRCDYYAIQRVMRILISNAIKYSEIDAYPRGNIMIQTEKNHGMITVSVKDFGIGIPPEHTARIFERFYRIDTSRAKKTGSSGLGLAIAHEIISAHGGEIFAESEVGKWTKVSFRLSEA